MKKLTQVVICFSLVIALCSWTVSSTVHAAEGSSGGSVTVKGKILFYEGEPTKDSTEEPKKPSQTAKPKDKGIFPKTGEARTTFFGKGILLVLVAMLAFLFKRNKKRGQVEE